MTYRYMSFHGTIKSGDTGTARSAALYRVLATMAVGERKSGGLKSAGIKWIERTS